jgi:hypothetical protein
MRNEFFAKALRVEVEVLRSELIVDVEELIERVWYKVISEIGEVIAIDEFRKMIEEELANRNWNIKFFKNEKNEPVTNIFKKLVRQIARERNKQLSNDSLSRVLNEVRKCYGDEGELSAGLYPAEAFFKRDIYNIPEDLGDSNSCFRSGGCNMGSALWLENEWEVYQRAWFVVFHYKSGNKEGVGRCWAYHLSGAVYITNFYSHKFEIKDDRFKKPIVRLIRRLFDLSENVKFATGKSAPLPIYLNGDGIVIYEPSQWESSAHVLDAIGHLKSKCLWCLEEVEIYELRKYDEPIYYSTVGGRVNGLIVCRNCSYQLDDMVYCHDCGEVIHPSDAHYIEGVGYICDRCFDENWFYCDECEEPHHRDYSIVTPDGRWLCENCASKIGAICGICGQYYYFDDEECNIQEYTINRGHWLSGVHICSRCAEKYLYSYQCHQCGRELHYTVMDFRNSERVRDMVRLEECLDCYCKRRRDAFDEAFENREHPSLFTYSIDPGERVLREILSME